MSQTKQRQLTVSQIKALQQLSDKEWQFIRDSIGYRLKEAGYAESTHVVKSIKYTNEGKITNICLAYRRTAAGNKFLKTLGGGK